MSEEEEGRRGSEREGAREREVETGMESRGRE